MIRRPAPADPYSPFYRHFCFVFLLLFIRVAAIAHAAGNGYLQLHFTDENGLPQNSVKSIVEDEYGFIWLTTEDGIVRYDGRNFISFGKQQLGLRSARFRFFYRENGHCYADNDKQERIRLEHGLPVKEPLQHVAAATAYSYTVKNGKPGLYAGELSENRRWQRYPDTIRLQLPGKIAYTCVSDSITCEQDGLFRYRKHIPNRYWWHFFVSGGSLYHFREGVFTRFSSSGEQAVKVTGAILKDNPGQLRTEELMICWNELMPDMALFYYRRSFYLAKPMPSGDLHTECILAGVNLEAAEILSVCYSPGSQTLYLGSASSGLLVLKPQPFHTFTSKGAQNVYYAQTPYNDTAILTSRGILYNSRGTAHTISAMSHLFKGDLYSLVTDKHGNIWIKSESNLYKLAQHSFKLKASWQFKKEVALLDNGADSLLWFATRSPDIYTINTVSDTANPRLFLSLPESITYLKQHGNILYAGTEKHIYAISLPDRKVRRVGGERNFYVSSIYVDKEHKVWFTTHGDGLHLISNDSAIALPLDKHKYLATAHCIVEDSRSFFWISTNKGLFQAARADLLAWASGRLQAAYYHYHDKYEGFNSNEFNGNCEPCAVKLKNGMVSFPSLNGLVTFYPDRVKTLLPAASLFIDKIAINGKEITPDALLRLPRWFNQLMISVSTPYMGNPANLHISYALIKDHEKPVWLDVPENGDLSFSTLPSGSYELVLRKSAGFGQDHFKELHIQMTVAKAWFETPVFYASALLIVAAIIVLAFRLRIRLIQKRNHELTVMVAAKTRELAWQTKLQERIIRTISHDVQTPLQHQVSVSRMLFDQLEDGKHTSLAEPARAIHESTYGLHSMIGNLLQYLKVRLSDTTIHHTETVHLHELVAEKTRIFEAISKRRNTTISNNVPSDLTVKLDGQMMSVILHNLMDNAVKITREGRIDIDARMAQGRCVITIRDTGPGLPRHIQDWINDPSGADLAGLATGSGEVPPSGIGLLTVRELVTTLGCTLAVVALPGKGTCFRIIC